MATARLAGEPPAAESIKAGVIVPLGPCDATASGAEDAQVRLVRERAESCRCGHHYQGMEYMLAAAGWRVTHDNRGRLA